MADMLSAPFQQAEDARSRQAPEEVAEPKPLAAEAEYDDEELLELWKDIKRETVDNQWVFHRQWQRNLWYILGRQWIEFQQKYGGWRDKRLAAWIPKSVTNKCKETIQTICAMFASIALSVNVRPNGAEPKNVSAAATADEMATLMHEVHKMSRIMGEFDFWLAACGNAFLHTYVEYDIKHGTITITAEQCADCGTVTPSNKLTGAQPVCPDCGGNTFEQAKDSKTGEPIQVTRPQGRPVTTTLSPLEYCFPNSDTSFDDIPYGVRARRRTKRYYESQPSLAALVPRITFNKASSNQSLQLFAALSQMNDLGVNSGFGLEGQSRGLQDEEGVDEYEVWMKPTMKYPDGLVFRIIDAGDPIVVHLEDEALPGPLPYTDAEGKPLFTFAHATFEHVGGRILGSGPIDAIIEKQNQLNQLDSHVLLCLSRMSNPVWLEPKGAEIQKLTGMPGLVIKYNALVSNGQSKPERIPGIPLDQSVMALREQYLRDIEELAGTFDILKGMKPAGVEAFSALQLLVERSQARFASVFQSRGDAYKSWCRFALELERTFGPPERTRAVLSPARRYTFKTYQRAQLDGAMTVVVEDGSTTPKTNLGIRAGMEHAQQLGLLNPNDPDQQYEMLKVLGLTRMIPTLDVHKQTALQMQEVFEDWAVTPGNIEQTLQVAQQQQAIYEQQVATFQQQTATSQQLADTTDTGNPLPAPLTPPAPPPSVLDGTPLKWQPWYSAQIHLQEFVKWANGDNVRELMSKVPASEELLRIHYQEIMAAMPMPVEAPVPGVGGGAGQAMANSNANSAPAGNTKQPAQPQTPPGKQSPQK